MKADEALRNYIDDLFETNPVEARKIVRSIKDRCGVSTAVYFNWRHGLTPIKKIFRAEITRIIGDNIFENVTD